MLQYIIFEVALSAGILSGDRMVTSFPFPINNCKGSLQFFARAFIFATMFVCPSFRTYSHACHVNDVENTHNSLFDTGLVDKISSAQDIIFTISKYPSQYSLNIYSPCEPSTYR